MAQSVLDLLRRPLLLKEFFFNQRIEFNVIELALAPTSLALLLVIRLYPNGVIHVLVDLLRPSSAAMAAADFFWVMVIIFIRSFSVR